MQAKMVICLFLSIVTDMRLWADVVIHTTSSPSLCNFGWLYRAQQNISPPPTAFFLLILHKNRKKYYKAFDKWDRWRSCSMISRSAFFVANYVRFPGQLFLHLLLGHYRMLRAGLQRVDWDSTGLFVFLFQLDHLFVLRLALQLVPFTVAEQEKRRQNISVRWGLRILSRTYFCVFKSKR